MCPGVDVYASASAAAAAEYTPLPAYVAVLAPAECVESVWSAEAYKSYMVEYGALD